MFEAYSSRALGLSGRVLSDLETKQVSYYGGCLFKGYKRMQKVT